MSKIYVTARYTELDTGKTVYAIHDEQGYLLGALWLETIMAIYQDCEVVYGL